MSDCPRCGHKHTSGSRHGEIGSECECPGAATVVQTGWPLTHLIACTMCGVLLWDVDTHYAAMHRRDRRWVNV